MSRAKCYESNAARQAAYRARRAARDETSARGEEHDTKPPTRNVTDEESGSMLCSSCGGYESHIKGCSDAQQREHVKEPASGTGGSAVGVEPGSNAKRAKLEALRTAVSAEQEKVVEAPVKPQIFRNDYGQIISEPAWNRLQKMKQHAKENHFEMDEYSQ